MFKTLRSRITALGVVVVMASLLMSTTVVYWVVSRENTQTLQQNLTAVTQGNARALSEWLDARVASVQAVEASSLDGDALLYMKQLEQSGGFIVAYVGYPDKRSVFSRDLGIPPDYDPTSRPWYKAAVAAGKLILTAPYEDVATKKLVVTLARPVLVGGQLKGVVAADVNLDAVTQTVKDVHPSPSSFAVVVDKAGRIVAHPNAELNLKPATDLSPDLTPALLGRLAGNETPERVVISGRAKLLHAEAVKGADFSLVVAMDESEAMRSLARVVQVQMLTLVLVAVGAALLMTWATASAFRRLTQVQRAMEDIGSEHGDLTKRLPDQGADEVAGIAQAFNHFAGKLMHVMLDVRNSSESVRTATSEIVQGNLDLSARTEQSAASLEETAASMAELTSTVHNSAESARHAGGLATEALNTASRGGEVMADAVTTMHGIADASGKIHDIIGVIDSIAFQTNILALNAAVEAARAGELGRGFAVVASEVRALAGRSASAAKEVRQLIDDSVDRVNQGSALVERAGQTVSEVVNSVKAVESVLREIAATTQEQSMGISQVNHAVSLLDTSTQQNAAMVEEASAAATFLNEQAHRLAEAVGQFKLSGA